MNIQASVFFYCHTLVLTRRQQMQDLCINTKSMSGNLANSTNVADGQECVSVVVLDVCVTLSYIGIHLYHQN